METDVCTVVKVLINIFAFLLKKKWKHLGISPSIPSQHPTPSPSGRGRRQFWSVRAPCREKSHLCGCIPAGHYRQTLGKADGLQSQYHPYLHTSEQMLLRTCRFYNHSSPAVELELCREQLLESSRFEHLQIRYLSTRGQSNLLSWHILNS